MRAHAARASVRSACEASVSCPTLPGCRSCAVCAVPFCFLQGLLHCLIALAWGHLVPATLLITLVAAWAGAHVANHLWMMQVRGYGLSGDAHHITQPPEDGAGAALAVRRALADGALRPADVAYVNAHATGASLCSLVDSLFNAVSGKSEYCAK